MAKERQRMASDSAVRKYAILYPKDDNLVVLCDGDLAMTIGEAVAEAANNDNGVLCELVPVDYSISVVRKEFKSGEEIGTAS